MSDRAKYVLVELLETALNNNEMLLWLSKMQEKWRYCPTKTELRRNEAGGDCRPSRDDDKRDDDRRSRDDVRRPRGTDSQRENTPQPTEEAPESESVNQELETQETAE